MDVRPDMPLLGAAVAHSGSNVTVICARGSTTEPAERDSWLVVPRPRVHTRTVPT